MPKIIPVIVSEVPRGDGTELDSHRTVTQYHTLDGRFLAEQDPVPVELIYAGGFARERDKLMDAIRWALGENGEFPERDPKKPYNWRTELRRRAGLEPHK